MSGPPWPHWSSASAEHRRLAEQRRSRRQRIAAAAAILAALGAALAVGIPKLSAPGPRPARASGGLAPRVASPIPPPPPRTPRAVRERRAEDRAIDRVLRYTPYISAGSPRRREVALTFDDGPGPYTLAVIRTLKRFNVPATFFQVGQMVPFFPEAAKAEVRGHYSIGDHTQSHPLLGLLSPALQRFQILKAAAAVRREEGVGPRLFRPPYGSFNRTTLKLLARQRLLMVLWTVDSEDYRRPGSAVIAQRVLAGARSGGIVLMHDGGGIRSQTVAALPTIIRALRARHLRLVTVPQLVRDDPPPRRQRLPPHIGRG